MTVYLVNHTRRSFVETNLFNSIDQHRVMTQCAGYHNGERWNPIMDEIQCIDKDTFNELAKEWECNGYELTFQLIKSYSVRNWCCHSDGNFEKDHNGNEYCCDEKYFENKMRKLIDVAEYYGDSGFAQHDSGNNLKFWETFKNAMSDYQFCRHEKDT